MEDFLQLAHDRYSCRSFDAEKTVEPAKVEAALEAALAAPTACNRQPWHAWVVTDPQAIAAIAATTRFTFDAKVIVVFGAEPGAAWTRRHDDHNFAEVDTAIAATHFMLELADEGLGTTWVAAFDAPALKAALPVLADHELVGMFPIGYPAADAEPAANHLACKPADELVSRI